MIIRKSKRIAITSLLLAVIAIFSFILSPLFNSSASAGAATWLMNGTSIYYKGGKVGIGLTSPKDSLNITGAMRFSKGAGFGRLVYNNGFHIKATDGIIGNVTSGNYGLYIGNNGDVSVGHAKPAADFDVLGNTKLRGNLEVGGNIISSGDICIGKCN